MPFNNNGLDTNLFTCRDDGTLEATVTFNNTDISPLNHDGTTNRLVLCLSVSSQTSVSTLHVTDSDLYVGRYVRLGQSAKAVVNLNSGSITSVETMHVGYNSTTATYRGWGELNMLTGTITAPHLYVVTGRPSEFSRVNMSGGLLDVSGTLGLQRNSISSFSGTARVEAGTFRLYAPSPAGSNPQCTLSGSAAVVCDTLTIDAGTLDLNDSAAVTISGDFQTQAAIYVSSGAITGGGMIRKVVISYDPTADVTTLTMGTDEMLRKAYQPSPAMGAQVFRQVSGLSWLAGNGAVSHSLYIAESPEQLAGSGLAPVYTGAVPAYAFSDLVDSGMLYWRVDEYDGTLTTTGDVWFFTASGVEIDSFDYADTAALTAVWTAGTGATLEKVTEASQVRLTYGNAASPYYSEASRVPAFTNFAGYGLAALDISFLGNGNNSAEPIFVTLSDGVQSATLVCPETMDSAQPIWQTWRIELAQFTQANGSLNLAALQSISFGVGDKTNPQAAGSGSVVFDDILLYEPRCLENNVYGDLNGDCRVDLRDFEVMTNQWQDNNLWPAD